MFRLGSDVVDWLYSHVQGFQDRREAKKYATQMLKHGYIKHTVNKNSFSEQCYYVFGDMVSFVSDVGNLRLDDDQCSERDTLLGHHQQQSNSPWHGRNNQAAYQGNYSQPQQGQFVPWGGETINYGVFGAGPLPPGPGSNSIVSGGSGDRVLDRDPDHRSRTPSATGEHEQGSQRSGPLPIASFKSFQQPQQSKLPLTSFGQVPFATRQEPNANMSEPRNSHSGRSDGSDVSSGSMNSQQPQLRDVGNGNDNGNGNGDSDAHKSNGQLDSVASDLTGSRQSLRMAMMGCYPYIDAM